MRKTGAPEPAALLGTQDDLLADNKLLGALVAKGVVQLVVGAGIDVEESIYYGLRTYLDPVVLAIHYKHRIVMVRLVEAVMILRCRADFG